jgi:hypothetical protein
MTSLSDRWAVAHYTTAHNLIVLDNPRASHVEHKLAEFRAKPSRKSGDMLANLEAEAAARGTYRIDR